MIDSVQDRSNLHLTQNLPSSETATEVVLDGQPPSDVWATLSINLLSEIAAGIESVITQSDASPPRAVRQALKTAETTEEQECVTASIVSSWRAGIDDERQWEAATFITSLGSGELLGGRVRTSI